MKKSSLSKLILIGLVAGVITGLVFGEYVGFLSILGDAFIGLLQMTVLPFIIVALIVNIGRLSIENGKRLVLHGLKFLAILLFIGLGTILLFSFALPTIPTSSFFSTSLVASPYEIDLIKLYIPSNPFYSLANNLVPAIVLFCIFLGIGVSGVKNKNDLLTSMDVLLEALNKVNKLVIKLTPLGVFAIAASTVGTFTLEEIGRLQAYIILYTLAVIVLTFGILPLLVSSTTNIKYSDLFGFTKDTLITIFATGKIIVVLPQLIDNIIELNKKYYPENKDASSNTDILMPLAYPFPNLGSFVIIIFVPFAAWFSGTIFTTSNYFVFLGAGLLSSFIAPVTGIPFLLELLHVPSDLFQLFIISTVYTDRIRVVLGAMHLIVLTILTLAALSGNFKFNKIKFIKNFSLIVVSTIMLLFSIRIYLASTSEEAEKNFTTFIQMDFVSKEVSSKHFINKRPPKLNEDLTLPGVSRIKTRGFIRVGYYKDMLPFAFVNENGKLVGYDIEFAHQIANEMKMKIEFVRISRDSSSILLNNGQIDIVMSGIALTPTHNDSISFSKPYMEQTMAFVTNDSRRTEFMSKDEVLKHNELRIGIPYTNYYNDALQNYLPQSRITTLSSPRLFFKGIGAGKNLDAILFFAEAGSAWTLVYPSFAVAVPQPDVIKIPMVFAVAKFNKDFLEYVNNFITLSQSRGISQELFDHWILGKEAVAKKEHWSVINSIMTEN